MEFPKEATEILKVLTAEPCLIGRSDGGPTVVGGVDGDHVVDSGRNPGEEIGAERPERKVIALRIAESGLNGKRIDIDGGHDGAPPGHHQADETRSAAKIEGGPTMQIEAFDLVNKESRAEEECGMEDANRNIKLHTPHPDTAILPDAPERNGTIEPHHCGSNTTTKDRPPCAHLTASSL